MLVNGKDGRAIWALPLAKVPSGAVMRASLQGDVWYYFGSHWVGRVLLCSGEGCPGCLHGPSRVMGYRVGLIQHVEKWRPALLEVSSGAIAGLQGFCEMEGLSDASGLVVELSRRGKRSPVRIEPVSSGGATMPPDRSVATVINAVAVLYGLPIMLPAEDPIDWAKRVQSMAAGHLASAVVHAR